jgi:hypothetical protein
MANKQNASLRRQDITFHLLVPILRQRYVRSGDIQPVVHRSAHLVTLGIIACQVRPNQLQQMQYVHQVVGAIHQKIIILVRQENMAFVKVVAVNWMHAPIASLDISVQEMEPTIHGDYARQVLTVRKALRLLLLVVLVHFPMFRECRQLQLVHHVLVELIVHMLEPHRTMSVLQIITVLLERHLIVSFHVQLESIPIMVVYTWRHNV